LSAAHWAGVPKEDALAEEEAVPENEAEAAGRNDWAEAEVHGRADCNAKTAKRTKRFFIHLNYGGKIRKIQAKKNRPITEAVLFISWN